MTQVGWFVDELLGERTYETGYPSLADAAEELGHKVYRTKYQPHSRKPDWGVTEEFLPGACVVSYGTVQFCKQVEKFFGKMWTPGMYFNENVKHFTRFAVPLRSVLLSDDYYILPYGEFCHRWRKNGDDVFIKPESGMKEFTGQVLSKQRDLEDLSPWGVIDDHTLCVVASPKDIKAEFRYIIVEGKVITGSEYRWDNVLDVRRDTHPICDLLAAKVAAMEWQADKAYVCDVALMEDAGARPHAAVIELNAFSSSGLYACNTYDIVKAVSQAALREHEGDGG